MGGKVSMMGLEPLVDTNHEVASGGNQVLSRA